jgi:hypothetical protein
MGAQFNQSLVSRKAAHPMAVLAFLTFTLIVLPILAVRAGADTWQRNHHNWT